MQMLRYFIWGGVLLALAVAGCESNRYQTQSGQEWKRQEKSHSDWQSDSTVRKHSRFDADMQHLRELDRQGKWELAEQLSVNIVYSSPEEWNLTEAREIGTRARQELSKGEMPRIGTVRTVDLGGNVRMNFIWCPPTQSWQWRLLSGGNVSVPLVLSDPPPPQKRPPDEKAGSVGRRQEYDLMTGFWISQTEVSQAQWEYVMRYNPSPIHGGNLPVSGISYWEAVQFADKLSEQLPGEEFWIPSAKEWDYACLAGIQIPKNIRKSKWSVAEQTVLNAPGYSSSSREEKQPHPIEQGQPNVWGIRNLIGNVQEWNSDWRGAADEYAAAASRLTRGGSWKDEPVQQWLSANQRYSTVGFRLIMQSTDVAERSKPTHSPIPDAFRGMSSVVVHDGDTVASLTRRFKLRPTALQEANRWPDGKLLQPGEWIWVPPPQWMPEPAAQSN